MPLLLPSSIFTFVLTHRSPNPHKLLREDETVQSFGSLKSQSPRYFASQQPLNYFSINWDSFPNLHNFSVVVVFLITCYFQAWETDMCINPNLFFTHFAREINQDAVPIFSV